MIDKATLLRKVDERYALRAAGDGTGVAASFAPEAVFRVAGADRFLPQGVAGPTEPGPAIQRLIQDFRFHAIERLDAVVEGNKAAVLSRVEVSVRGGEVRSVEMFDLIEINDDGLFTSMVQFTDTALMSMLLDEARA